MTTSDNKWREPSFDDIPSREEFEQRTLDLLAEGVTNSDEIRDAIRRERKLILAEIDGNWNSSPSNKFVNEHAFVLAHLVRRRVIRPVAPKRYQFVIAGASNTHAIKGR